MIVDAIGRRCREPFANAEDLGKDVVEPEPRGRPAKQVPMLREKAPDGARVALDGPAVRARHAERLERDALAVEHPEYVMIGRDEEGGWVGERLVVGEPARVGMAVRTDDGE